MFVILCKNNTSDVEDQPFGTGKPENAAQTEAAASIDGGYIRNFSSKKKKDKNQNTSIKIEPQAPMTPCKAMRQTQRNESDNNQKLKSTDRGTSKHFDIKFWAK